MVACVAESLVVVICGSLVKLSEIVWGERDFAGDVCDSLADEVFAEVFLFVYDPAEFLFQERAGVNAVFREVLGHCEGETVMAEDGLAGEAAVALVGLGAMRNPRGSGKVHGLPYVGAHGEASIA